MMQYTQVIIGIQQIADMEIHDRCVDFAAISILFEAFRHGDTVLLQACKHFIVRNRTGIHVAQRRELAAHFIEQLLTAAQISSFLPPRGNTHIFRIFWRLLYGRITILTTSATARPTIVSVKR